MRRSHAFVLVFMYALLSHLYFVLRFSGNWGEGDTGRMAVFAQYVQKQGTILPSGLVYSNGPGHSTLVTMLTNLTGVSIGELLQYILPLVGGFSVIMAYIAFLELTKNRKIALLAAFLLSIQPDFLFTSSRGTHEKFTYSMILMSMLFLSRSFTQRRNIRQFIYYVLLFYLAILGMISYNFFFASTYVFASTFALVIGYVTSKIPQITTSFKRLIYTSSTSSVFFFTYMFYIYTPSRNLFHLFDTLTDKVGAVALATEQHVTPQYDYIFIWWISFKVWLFLTLFNWVVAVLSFSAWIWLVYKFLWKKESLSRSLQLLLMFYAAFSLQLLITIFGDRFGVFDNLELRVFPVLMFFAVPLASVAMINLINTRRLNENMRKLIRLFFVLLLLIFVVNSLLKATNDPLVSNKWFFYSAQEKEGLTWIEHNLNTESIWAGLDERLISVFNVYADVGHNTVEFTRPQNAEFWLFSELINKRAKQVKFPLPDTEDKPVVYDSGEVKIYRNGEAR